MKTRKIVISAALLIIGLPVMLVLIAASSVFVLNKTNGTIESSGRKREYLQYVPRSYNRARPTPLVISLHGAGLWPAAQARISQWNRVADEQGFVAVYPSGTGVTPPGLRFLPKLPAWRMKPEAALTAEIRFISELIDTLEATYNIDSTRIYVDGYSNGGGMAFVLSCALSQRIAAVGAVAAAQELPWNWCTDRRPVPMIAVHGTADRFVSYQGGPSGDPFNPVQFPAVLDWVANWAHRNRCGSKPVESVVADDVTRLEYTDCADAAGVLLYTVKGGGHSWPGGKPLPKWMIGVTSRSIDASSQMWAFFREHRLQNK